MAGCGKEPRRSGHALRPGRRGRTMKVQEVLLQALSGKLTWPQAEEILGWSGSHRASLAAALPAVRLRRALGSPAPHALPAARTAGRGRAHPPALPRAVRRLQWPAFLRPRAPRSRGDPVVFAYQAGPAGWRLAAQASRPRPPSPPELAAAVARHSPSR